MSVEGILFLILRVFVCQTFFFTRKVPIGTSVHLFVKGIHIRSTHKLQSISHHYICHCSSVALSCLIPGSVLWQLRSSSSLIVFPSSRLTIDIHGLAMFKANRSKRTDNMRDFSSVTLHQIPLHKRHHHTDHAIVFTRPDKGCAIP